MNKATTSRFVLIVSLFVTGCGGSAQGGPGEPKQRYDAVIIGAGMGGLSAATHLALHGQKVLVVEQGAKVGGCTSSFSRGPFHFDASVHEIAGGGRGAANLQGLIEATGLSDKVELIRLPDLGRAIYPGVDIRLPANVPELSAVLEAKYPQEKDGIRKYYDLMARVYSDIAQLGSAYRRGPVARTGLLLLVPLRQPSLFKLRKSSLGQVLDETFTSPELKALAAQLWQYLGPPPSRLWAPMGLVAHHSYLEAGTWQVKGSTEALANAYAARIEELGGTILLGTRATAIEIQDGKVRGVHSDGGYFATDIVVSNADPFQTFHTLVGRDKAPKDVLEKLDTWKPSNSLVSLYLGLDVPASSLGITDYEIFMTTTTDLDTAYDSMMDGTYKDLTATLTFYSNLGDPFYAPPDKATLVIATYASIDNWPTEAKAYAERRQSVTNTLLDACEKVVPGLRDHIEVMELATPRTIERYTLQHRGVPYGWDMIQGQEERMPNTTDIEGLYLAGSWTVPSHGVTGAQISGFHAAKLILQQD